MQSSFFRLYFPEKVILPDACIQTEICSLVIHMAATLAFILMATSKAFFTPVTACSVVAGGRCDTLQLPSCQWYVPCSDTGLTGFLYDTQQYTYEQDPVSQACTTTSKLL